MIARDWLVILIILSEKCKVPVDKSTRHVKRGGKQGGRT